MTAEDATTLTHVEDDAVMLERSEPDEGDGRTMLIRLLRWGEVANATDERGRPIRETFARGAFAGVDPTRVTIEAQGHDRELVGRGEAIEEREDGAYLRARIARTHAGDDLLTLVRDGVLRAASVVFRPLLNGSRVIAGGVHERTAVELARVAVLDRGAYPSAAVLAVRAEAEVSAMADEATPVVTEEEPAAVADEPTPDPTPTPEPLQERAAPQEVPVTAPEPFDPAPIVSRLDGIDQRLTVLSSASAPPAPTVPELYAIPTLHDFLQRSEADRAIDAEGHLDDAGIRASLSRFLARDVADEVTTDNAGVMPPSWLQDIKRIVNLGRPAISAFGGPTALPPTGMEIDWPYLSTSNTIIGEQLTQKTEVTSAKVSFAKGSASVKTYAGVADIAYQLSQRSSPSYREARNRVMLAAWASVTDAAFVAAALSGGTAATYGWDADATGQNLKEALFAASVQVETATGMPAQFALCATDVFTQLARLTQIVPPVPVGNPSNAVGTAEASTLGVIVAGLPLIHVRGLATGNVIVSNRMAATWFEEGPRNVTAEDVAKLGTNDAWYSFAAPALFVPAGIVKLFGPGASGS